MLLNYIQHQNVSGGVDTLDKVRQFAVAQGWTQEEWRSGEGWEYASDGTWETDTDCAYLCLSSTGQGTTSLIARLQLLRNRSHSELPYFHIAMSSNTTYTTSTYSAPYCQNAITHVETASYSHAKAMHIGTATYDNLYIFGNDHWICAVLDMNGVFCQIFHFGQYEMFDSNPTDGQCCGFYGHTVYNQDTEWWKYDASTAAGSTRNNYLPFWGSPLWVADGGFSFETFDMYWDGSDQGDASNIYYNIFPGLNYTSSDDRLDVTNVTYQLILNLWDALNVNGWSGRRVMSKMTILCKYATDGTIKPVCKSPMYVTKFSGLAMAEQITYGSDTYMMFPIVDITDQIGVGFRIA